MLQYDSRNSVFIGSLVTGVIGIGHIFQPAPALAVPATCTPFLNPVVPDTFWIHADACVPPSQNSFLTWNRADNSQTYNAGINLIQFANFSGLNIVGDNTDFNYEQGGLFQPFDENAASSENGLYVSGIVDSAFAAFQPNSGLLEDEMYGWRHITELELEVEGGFFLDTIYPGESQFQPDVFKFPCPENFTCLYPNFEKTNTVEGFNYGSSGPWFDKIIETTGLRISSFSEILPKSIAGISAFEEQKNSINEGLSLDLVSVKEFFKEASFNFYANQYVDDNRKNPNDRQITSALGAAGIEFRPIYKNPITGVEIDMPIDLLAKKMGLSGFNWVQTVNYACEANTTFQTVKINRPTEVVPIRSANGRIVGHFEIPKRDFDPRVVLAESTLSPTGYVLKPYVTSSPFPGTEIVTEPISSALLDPILNSNNQVGQGTKDFQVILIEKKNNQGQVIDRATRIIFQPLQVVNGSLKPHSDNLPYYLTLTSLDPNIPLGVPGSVTENIYGKTSNSIFLYDAPGFISPECQTEFKTQLVGMSESTYAPVYDLFGTGETITFNWVLDPRQGVISNDALGLANFVLPEEDSGTISYVELSGLPEEETPIVLYDIRDSLNSDDPEDTPGGEDTPDNGDGGNDDPSEEPGSEEPDSKDDPTTTPTKVPEPSLLWALFTIGGAMKMLKNCNSKSQL